MRGLWQNPVRAGRGAGEEGNRAGKARTLQLPLGCRLRSPVRARRTAPKAQGEQRRKDAGRNHKSQERLRPVADHHNGTVTVAGHGRPAAGNVSGRATGQNALQCATRRQTAHQRRRPNGRPNPTSMPRLIWAPTIAAFLVARPASRSFKVVDAFSRIVRLGEGSVSLRAAFR
jgi:hypothetical protein